jgi:hypothetical protein
MPAGCSARVFCLFRFIIVVFIMVEKASVTESVMEFDKTVGNLEV